jgi:hypothetical protein
MNRVWLLMVVLACPVLTLAQSRPPGSGGNRAPYQPVVAAPTTTVYGGGGWGGYGGASTAAGSAMNGMSQVISSAGQYNLDTSAAAVNMTQAQSNALQNQVQACNTFWEMQNTGRAQRAAQRGPPPTPEQIARMARMGMPRPLSPSEMDPVSGRLTWPDALQDTSFDAERRELDQIFAKRANYGGIDHSDREQVRQVVDTMFDGLKAQIKQIPPQTYADSRRFLQSLVYAATKTTLD